MMDVEFTVENGKLYILSARIGKRSGIVSSMFFGGITGSAQACSSCMGGILIPAMVKEGYSAQEAAGVIASASTCGPIIPPSIIMVVYATAVGVSVGSMFMGGVVPGILCGLILMLSLIHI